MGLMSDLVIEITEDITKRTGRNYESVLEDVTGEEYGDLSFLASLYRDRSSKKTIMFYDDFYTAFCLFATTDRADLLEAVRDLENGRPHEIDPEKHTMLYDSTESTFLTPAAVKDLADEAIYNGDLYED